MTNSVNKVPLSSVEETTINKLKEVDEFDVVDNFDTNFILEGAEELEQIEINVFANQVSHPEDLDVDSQVSEIKSLSKEDVSENGFIINDKKGFISIENISIPEESNVSNLREITISGKFLPWPKHLPDKPPKNYEFLLKNLSVENSLDGILLEIQALDGEIKSEMFFGSSNIGYGSDYSFHYGNSELVNLNVIYNIIGILESNLKTNSLLSNFLSLSSSLNSFHKLSGEITLDQYGTNYGNNYGSSFGDVYGSGEYSTGKFGE